MKKHILNIILLLSFLSSSSNAVKKENKAVQSHNDTIALDTIKTKCSKEYLYKTLSSDFNYKLCFCDVFKGDVRQKHYWIITVLDKEQTVIDSFQQPFYVFYPDSSNYDEVVRYEPDDNSIENIVNGYPGIFVVADFNFDSKDDFAIVIDRGSPSGAFYSYYIQNENGSFYNDRYLTDSIIYFPSSLNNEDSTYTYFVPIGYCGVAEYIYKIDENKHWHLKEKIKTGDCKSFK